MTNTNCLEGIKCFACGNEDSFRIAARTIATVCDDGIEDHSEMEWDDDSYADCTKCCRHGTLKDFTVKAESPPTMKPVDAILTAIANEHLGISTLETRRSDNLDFREVSVWGAHAALKAAFDAGGKAAAVSDMLAAMRLALEALNTAPRFRVGDTDSYKIAAIVDRTIADVTVSQKRGRS
jgi:hypothetical protein